jgi:hypothetical protein
VAAPPALRPAVALAIEADAAVKARAVVEATTYVSDSARKARNAWCAEHWDDG